jgi:hypothetical protein
MSAALVVFFTRPCPRGIDRRQLYRAIIQPGRPVVAAPLCVGHDTHKIPIKCMPNYVLYNHKKNKVKLGFSFNGNSFLGFAEVRMELG